MNVGAVENEGYDISLSVMPIQDYERQIQWSISMNGSHNRNVIKKISNEMKAMNQKNLEKKNGSPEAISRGREIYHPVVRGSFLGN